MDDVSNEVEEAALPFDRREPLLERFFLLLIVDGDVE